MIISVLSSCYPEDEGYPEGETFGIRDDINFEDYVKVGANQAPYNTVEYPDFSAVIMFSYSLDGSETDDYVATGVLVKPDWILTAGHNFFVAEEQDDPALASGIFVLTGSDPNNPTNTYTVEKLVFFPSWIEQNEDFIKANDLCLVKLSSPITSITPMEINYETTEAIGNTVWYCGFGDYSQQEGHDANSFSEKHAIENILDRKVDGITSSSGGTTYYGGLLAFDFDSPSGDVNSLGDETVNDDEAMLGAGTSSATATFFEGATVQGDSGGPLFIKIGETWKVCGVLSGGASEPIDDHYDSSYGDISVFIRTSSHSDWIQSVIN